MMTGTRVRVAALAAVAVAVSLLLAACASVPYTNRSQLMLIGQQEELSLGASAYREAIGKAKLSASAEGQAQVERVGRRIAAVAERPDYQWQFSLVEDGAANAYCLPGGKVVVYTGIMPFTRTEAGLAVVVAHEVAHALARHGAERLSRGILLQMGEGVLLAAVESSHPGAVSAVALAYGLGTTVGVELPFSRAQELEADHIGLILMAKAGYDPREAVAFWERMSAQKEAKKLPQFLSTHPYDDVRLQELEGWMPEADDYYQAYSHANPHPSATPSPNPASK